MAARPRHPASSLIARPVLVPAAAILLRCYSCKWRTLSPPSPASPAQPSPWQNFAGIPFPVLRLHQLEIRVRNTQLCHAPNPQHPAGVCQLGPSPVSSLFAWILMEMCRVAADLITAARWIISVSNSPLNISITSAGLGWAGLDH